jgi:hypothetical protein
MHSPSPQAPPTDPGPPFSRPGPQPVRGDACLFVDDACPSELERLLAGQPPRRVRRPAPDAAPAPAPAPAPAAVLWVDLPPHVIASIALDVGPAVSQIMPLFGTCR